MRTHENYFISHIVPKIISLSLRLRAYVTAPLHQNTFLHHSLQVPALINLVYNTSLRKDQMLGDHEYAAILTPMVWTSMKRDSKLKLAPPVSN